MERSSEFVKDKAIFGSFPKQESVEEFENIGVRYFVDLTCDGESKITPYKTKYTYIRYPIIDRRIPTNWHTFAQFIIRIGNIIKSLDGGEMLYLSCKGGHGRSGLVVACLLCYLYKISPSEALENTNKYHSRRKDMREKWRRLGSPQTGYQKRFVSKFFEPLYVYGNHTKYFSSGFNNDANIPVMIPGFGLFPTATSAFYSFKDSDNIEYVKNMELLTDITEIRSFIKTIPDTESWLKKREDILYYILNLKFEQNDTIREHLLNTGLRPIIVKSDDLYYGNTDKHGKNILSKSLMVLRSELYKK